MIKTPHTSSAYGVLGCARWTGRQTTGPALEPFREELAKYKTGKDTIQFPYDKPLPRALIRRIAAYRVKQVRESDARWMY